MKNVFCAVDLGTSKIACGLFLEKENGEFELIGFGEESSQEMKKGILLNSETAAVQLQRALEEAQRMAGIEQLALERIYLNVLAEPSKALFSTGIIAVSNQTDPNATPQVSHEDLARALKMAESVSLPTGTNLLHTIPIEYMVDENEVKEPVGVSGVRFEVRVCLITCTRLALESLEKMLQRLEFEKKELDLTLDTLASAEAVLSEEERKAGAVLLDIGHRSSSALFYYKDSVWELASLPVGGAHLTQDLAYGLKTSMEQAEKIKKERGVVMMRLAVNQQPIIFPLLSYKKTAETTELILAKILEPRCRELFELIKERLEEKVNWERVGSGVVLTGGGALCAGMTELAEEVFGLPCRLGEPLYVKGVKKDLANPRYASLVGLAKIACLNRQKKTIPASKNSFNGIISPLKKFLKNLLE